MALRVSHTSAYYQTSVSGAVQNHAEGHVERSRRGAEGRASIKLAHGPKADFGIGIERYSSVGVTTWSSPFLSC